ncbi:MAG: hypothetical protein HQL52_01560 [Magnetococcales bacterium]|nr:hypothetical protein [Magnetococcales bacterium]
MIVPAIGGMAVAWFRPAALLIVFIVVGFAAVLPQPAHGQEGPPVTLQKAKGEACVEDTAWMRRNHMDYLKHKRDRTVREGYRAPDESLLNCRTCHTSREQFCDRCHTYVGVKPDCFECHNYPK